MSWQISGKLVEFPAILPSDDPLWPEFWEKDALLGIKASLPVGKMECTVATNANYVRIGHS